MGVSRNPWSVSWKGGKTVVTMGELIEAIKIGNGKLGKSTALRKIATVAGATLYVGDSTLQKACNGNGILQCDVKASIMTNWNAKEKDVLAYIDCLIKDIGQTAMKLGIPHADEYNKELLCKAVRYQFAAFFDAAAGIDVDNHIPDLYQKLLDDPNAMPVVGAALYPGDAAYDYSRCKRYEMDVYGTLHYEMELQNTGKIPWVNRTMVYVDEGAKVRPSINRIPIPEKHPNGIVKLHFDLIGRGAEGTSNIRWKMVDANGEDCFPNEPDKFHMEIITTFTPKD